MTFKDLIRLLKRRWKTATIVFLVVALGFFGVSQYVEKPLYRARTRVLISTPPVIVTAAQGTQFISVNQMEPKTWLSIIASRKIKEEAEKLLKRKSQEQKLNLPVKPEWFNSIAAIAESESQLVWIEAVGSSPEIAAEVANVVAQAASEHSEIIAQSEIVKARDNAARNRDDERRTLASEEAAASGIREDARARLGADNLELEIRKLNEESLSHDSRGRDLKRRINTNDLRLSRIVNDRAAGEHLQRTGVPRVGTASSESRVAENTVVQKHTERIEKLHLDLLANLHRYTEQHPTVMTLRADLRQAEIELTDARIKALGRDIDHEELTLRTDSELAEIERNVLAPEVSGLRDRLALLQPVLRQVESHDRKVHDARTRVESLTGLIDQLESAPRSGYVRRLEGEDAKPLDAVAIEMQLRKSLPVALLAALIVGISFAFLLDFLDTSLRNDYDVRRHLDYPVLAVVPKVGTDEVLTVHAAKGSILSDIFDTLATVLLSSPSERPCRVFLITSTNPQEGKTAMSINLALALARQGKRTLLIDGDLRVPAVHSRLVLPNNIGLSDVLAGTATLQNEGIIQDTEVPNLRVLTSGPTPDNSYELLDPVRLGPIMAQAREAFNAIVIDTPPVLRTGDPLKLSAVADTVLFIVEAGKTDQRQATWAKRLLTNVGARVQGVVLNQAEAESEEYYYYYGKSYGRGYSRSGTPSRKESRTT